MKPESASDSDLHLNSFLVEVYYWLNKNRFGKKKLACLTLSKVYLPRTRICLNSLDTKYQRQD